MGETFYDVLEVDADASQAEITEAYRERVLETHPDHNDDPDAVEAFKRVDAAESVLSDEHERARYDRLGHNEYVRLEEGFGTNEDEPEGGESTSRPERSTPSEAADAWTRSEGPSESDGPSHHARRRRRRERATARAGGTAADWWVRDEPTGTWDETADRREDDGDETGDGFSYSVHDWDDDVELEREDPPLDDGTKVVVAVVTLLYPVLVYASVAPRFSVFVNALVAGCTLVLVGYLLTMPRIALGAFGCWSLLVPPALPRLRVDPFSPVGLLAVGAVWIPFGYAVAVWWALRP